MSCTIIVLLPPTTHDAFGRMGRTAKGAASLAPGEAFVALADGATVATGTVVVGVEGDGVVVGDVVAGVELPPQPTTSTHNPANRAPMHRCYSRIGGAVASVTPFSESVARTASMRPVSTYVRIR